MYLLCLDSYQVYEPEYIVHSKGSSMGSAVVSPCHNTHIGSCVLLFMLMRLRSHWPAIYLLSNSAKHRPRRGFYPGKRQSFYSGFYGISGPRLED